MKKKIKTFLIILVVVIGIPLLVGAGYAIYALASYYRIEDNLALDVVSSDIDAIEIGPNNQYTITSWNIGFGAYTDDYSFFMDGGKYSRARSLERLNKNMSDIVSELNTLKSDFYLVQEVDIDATRSYHVNQLEYIIDNIKNFSWSFAINYDSPYLFYPITEPHGKSKAGLLTMSKYNISSALRRSLPIQEDFAKFYDLDRCYSINRIKTSNGKELVLINLHLSAYTTDGTIAEQQLKMLNEDIIKEYQAGNYIICGGDFNKDLLGNSPEIFGVSGEEHSWAAPLPLGDIPANFDLIAPLDKDNPVPSCRNAKTEWDPKTNFQVTLDGFIISNNVHIINSKVVDQQFKYSDHHPVQIVVTLVPSV